MIMYIKFFNQFQSSITQRINDFHICRVLFSFIMCEEKHPYFKHSKQKFHSVLA